MSPREPAAEAAAARVPPHSVEAEQSVLGGLLLDNLAWGRAAELVTAGDFYRYEHQLIFSAIECLMKQQKPADVVTVQVQLKSQGKDEEAGGLAYLNALAQSVPSAANMRRYAEVVRERAALRKLIALADEAAAAAFNHGDCSASDLAAVFMAKAEQVARPASLFREVAPAAMVGAEPPPIGYWWAGLVPAGAVTLLGAHGGVGKSMLALMLAAAVTHGAALFGVPTRQGRVLFLSAEDPQQVVLLRLRRVCEALGLDPAVVAQRLLIVDATGADAALYAEVSAGGARSGTITPAHRWLERRAVEFGADLLVLDNASDLFDANEIDRARVRGFMRALAQLAQPARGVLLLAHVDKATARAGKGLGGSEGYSGSTAWNNSARSRLFLSRDKDGALLLEHQKHNLGPLHDPIRLCWPAGGMPMLDAQPGGIVGLIAERNHARAVLRLLAEFTARGEFVSTATTSRTHAGKLLGGQPGFPKLSDPELFDLLRSAERAGHLARHTYKGDDRKARERWELTPAGREVAGLAATAATLRHSESHRSGAVPAEPAATAATSPPGGVGGKARTTSEPQSQLEATP